MVAQAKAKPDLSFEDETIWDKAQIRIMAKRVVDSVGGKAGFRAIGPTMRRAVIAEACWNAVRTGAMVGPVTISQRQMFGLEQAMRRAAGMTEEDDFAD